MPRQSGAKMNNGSVLFLKYSPLDRFLNSFVSAHLKNKTPGASHYPSLLLLVRYGAGQSPVGGHSPGWVTSLRNLTANTEKKATGMED